MHTKNPTNLCSPCLKPTPIATMTFKVEDLMRDVDCLKSTYGVSVDPNKTRIERVLSNMKRKLIKVDQMLKFGHCALEYSITEDRPKVVLQRVQKLKQLFKDLIKAQCNISTPERRSLSQMFHQLLRMEEDLVHFADPGNSDSSFVRCRNNEETHWQPAKDCEVQALLLEDSKLDGMASSENSVADFGMKKRSVCSDHPEIEDSSDYGEEETRGTVFSITNRRTEQSLFSNGVLPIGSESMNLIEERFTDEAGRSVEFHWC